MTHPRLFCEIVVMQRVSVMLCLHRSSSVRLLTSVRGPVPRLWEGISLSCSVLCVPLHFHHLCSGKKVRLISPPGHPERNSLHSNTLFCPHTLTRNSSSTGNKTSARSFSAEKAEAWLTSFYLFSFLTSLICVPLAHLLAWAMCESGKHCYEGECCRTHVDKLKRLIWAIMIWVSILSLGLGASITFHFIFCQKSNTEVWFYSSLLITIFGIRMNGWTSWPQTRAISDFSSI